HFALDDRGAISAGNYHGIDFRQLEAGDQVRSQAGFDGGSDAAGVLHDGVEHANANLHSSVRERHFWPRPGNLRQLVVADGGRFDLRFAGSGWNRKYAQEGALRSDYADLS